MLSLVWKDKQNNKSTTLCLILLSASHLVYAISKILIIYLEEYTDPKLYFVWMVLSFMGLCMFVGLYLFVKQFYEQKEGVISAN